MAHILAASFTQTPVWGEVWVSTPMAAQHLITVCSRADTYLRDKQISAEVLILGVTTPCGVLSDFLRGLKAL